MRTINEIFEICFKEYWSKDRFIKSGHAAEVRRNYENHISSSFGGKTLLQLKASAIRAWHNQRESTPVAANRSLEVLSRIVAFAIEKEWHPQNANPCKLVRAFPERKRKRFANENEIRNLSGYINEEAKTNPQAAAFLQLLIFSGSRPRAIENATWSDLKTFNFNGRTFATIDCAGKSTTRTGENERIFVPPQAYALLAGLPRQSEKIFTIKMPRRLWAKIRAKAGCEDLWVRDWRRTFATIGLSNDIGMDVIGGLLNHKTTQTTMIYAKLNDSARITATEKIANKIEELAQPMAKIS